MPKDKVCSFCRKPPNEVGPIVEGPGTGNGSVFICRDCAELAIEILYQESRRRGGKAAKMSKFTRDMIDVCTKGLERYEALSKQRGLTEIELEHKRKVEAELERLKSEGPWGGSGEP